MSVAVRVAIEAELRRIGVGVEALTFAGTSAPRESIPSLREQLARVQALPAGTSAEEVARVFYAPSAERDQPVDDLVARTFARRVLSVEELVFLEFDRIVSGTQSGDFGFDLPPVERRTAFLDRLRAIPSGAGAEPFLAALVLSSTPSTGP